MLIRNAEIVDGSGPTAPGGRDVRIEGDEITAVGQLDPLADEAVLDAHGGALLPGLHDHHIHLLSFAASLDSLRCGPPEVTRENDLIEALARCAPGRSGWIRGFGYHDSVAGEIDRAWLDQHGPPVPIRIQHRSGRLWILNSLAMQALPEPIAPSGRLYDQDAALRRWLPRSEPDVASASRQLASYGVTTITDMTPTNDNDTRRLLRDLAARGALRQRLILAGSADLDTPGPTKIHLHESALPAFDELCATIRISHQKSRCVAVHCVTDTELVYTLAAIREVGPRTGDRIEHASVTPPESLVELRELGLTVVTQPNFVAERGDAYLSDVPAAEHPWLYRGRAFLDHRIPLLGGTDAPFGHPDPWRAMQAAVTRRTQRGRLLGAAEAISPEQALALFIGPAIVAGSTADLCLLTQPWSEARQRFSCDLVRATIRGGELIYDRVDQAPA